MTQKISWGKRILLMALSILFLGAAFFGIYTSRYYHALPYDTGAVTIENTDSCIIYGDAGSHTGFIFYPGAKVAEEAYAPVMSQLAEQGVLCVVVKMPFHFAVFDRGAAEKIKGAESFSGVQSWYLGGHSLGGAMAAGFAAEHESSFKGLVLMAAYPTKELKTLPVLSLYGSEDGVLNMERYARALPLSSNLEEHVIQGGNHAQFGNYGEQKGDHPSDLTAEEQWQEVSETILSFIF